MSVEGGPLEKSPPALELEFLLCHIRESNKRISSVLLIREMLVYSSPPPPNKHLLSVYIFQTLGLEERDVEELKDLQPHGPGD